MPAIEEMACSIASTWARLRPSEKFGTHSINNGSGSATYFPARPVQDQIAVANRDTDVINAEAARDLAVIGKIEDQDISALSKLEATAKVSGADRVGGVDRGGGDGGFDREPRAQHR